MNSMPKTTTDRQIAITLGFWSAILASVFTLSFVVLAVGTTLVSPPKTWSGIQTYAENFNWPDMASFIPAMVIFCIVFNQFNQLIHEVMRSPVMVKTLR